MPYEEACSSAIGLLRQLSKEELENLLSSDEKVKGIIADIPQVGVKKQLNDVVMLNCSKVLPVISCKYIFF